MSTLKPVAVAPMGGELAISWNDGIEQYIPLKLLRCACPCALCCGEPDVLGRGDAPTIQVHELRAEII